MLTLSTYHRTSLAILAWTIAGSLFVVSMGAQLVVKPDRPAVAAGPPQHDHSVEAKETTN